MPCTCQNAFNKLSGGYKTIGCNCKGADYTNKNCLKPEDVYETKKDTTGKCTCKNPESIKKCCQCCAAASAPPPQEEEDEGLDTGLGEGGSIKSGGSKGSKNGKPKKFLLKISPESLEATCLCGEECTCTVCTCKPHTLYEVEDIDEIEDTCIELVETKKKCKNSQSLKFILRLTPEQMLQMCLVWCEENCDCPLCVCRLEELFGCKKVTAVNIYCLLRLKKRRTGCVGISDLSGSGGGGGEGTGGQTGIGDEEGEEEEESKISSDVSSLEYPPGTEESSESDMGAVIHAPCKCKDGSDKPKSCKELGLVCKKAPVCRKLPCGTCTCNPSPSCPPPPCRSYPCVPPPCPPPPRCPALKPPCRKPPPCPPPRCPRCYPPPPPRCPPPKCPSRRCPPPPPCPPRCPPPPPCYRC